MTARRDVEAAALRQTDDPEAYLLEHSGLPGPRANLELIEAAADVVSAGRLRRWAAIGPDEAGTNEPRCFLACCGVVGLGRLAVQGDRDAMGELREHASDPRWRVREAVAMGLQRVGDADAEALVGALWPWVPGTALERRAVAAAIAEPRLLREPAIAAEGVRLVDAVTEAFASLPREGPAEEGTALRKTLGYAWSVVIVAAPGPGKPAFERWLGSPDRDVRWICRENLRKARLRKLDADWVRGCAERLAETERA